MSPANQPKLGDESPSPSGEAPADLKRQLETLVEDYLERRQIGEQPDRYELMLRHLALAREAEQRLQAIEVLHGLAESQRAAGLETSGHGQVSPGSSLPEPPDSAIENRPQPAVLGRYQLRTELGTGASAIVYRAYDPKFHREVALKVFRVDQPAGADFVERFDRDAQIVAQLRHPNIVPLHETGEDGCQCYIDMELIEGQTLETRLQRQLGQARDLREAAELVRKVAQALDYAHSRGIVHRDVKPSNILLDACGEPQITDFGLARQVDSEQTITKPGQILGTPVYMSPEQAAGRAHEADGRSDVFSLGVVLYRLLSGRLPFESTDPLAVLEQILHQEPPRPWTLNAAIPRDLETICMKALEKDAAYRFASAGAFAEEIWRWLQDEPLRIRPPTWWERLRRWARRERLVASVVAEATVLLVVVTTVLGGIAYQAHVQAEFARDRERLEAETRAQVEVWALLDQARQRLRTPTQGRRFATQQLLRTAAERRREIAKPEVTERIDLETRSLWAATLGVPDLQLQPADQAKLPFQQFFDRPAALHPHGEAMVIGTHRGPVYWSRGHPLQLPEGLDPGPPGPHLAYSPTGKYLVFAPASGGLQIWGEDVSRILARPESPAQGVVLAIGFDRAETSLWACHVDGRVRSWSLPGFREGARPWMGEPTLGPFTAAQFSADASLLALGNKIGHVLICESNGKLPRALPPAEVEVQCLAWSPDSSLLAVGTKDGNLQLRHKEGTLAHHLTPFAYGVGSIQFTPDGRWLLAGHIGEMKMWEVATGEQILTGPYVPWGFAPDGRRWAGVSGDGVAFCDLLVPNALQHLSGHHAGIELLAWSRDNRHLVSLDDRFEVRVWDVVQGVAVDHFRKQPGGYFGHNAAVALSDDAKLVAFASGGREEAHALIHDLTTGQVHTWPLPGGFEQLAYIGEGKFLLVREEHKVPGSKAVQTVVRELSAGKPPDVLRILRHAEADDIRRFFNSGLTPDGRYYYWSGPREPRSNQRAEVYEVATGRRLFRIAHAPQSPQQELGVFMSPDGRYCWIIPSASNTGNRRRYDLAGTSPPERVAGSPHAVSPDSAWLALVRTREKDRPGQYLALQPWAADRAWLEFADDSPAWNDFPCAIFSSDGRFLAWGRRSGRITVADLPALQQEISAFEKSLPK
jgi:WD40 repeat protein/tRNA A-37 threonylcarbamoyl transferase component Bud32